MKTLVQCVAMIALVALFAASGCVHETDTPPQLQFTECTNHADCDVSQLCLSAEDYDGYYSWDVEVCQAACQADFERISNEDGTYTVVKVPGSDSCQRDGTDTHYCYLDPEAKGTSEYGQCVPDGVTPQPIIPPPTKPDPTKPDPVTTSPYVKITCCFDPALLAGVKKEGDEKPTFYMVNFGWSTVDTAKNVDWEPGWNHPMDKTGPNGELACGTTDDEVLRTEWYAFRIWVELTLGPVANDHLNWQGSGVNGEFTPVACYADDVPVPVGPHYKDCGFGFAGAVEQSCHE